MKRWAIGSIAFFVTFAVGSGLAWAFFALAQTLGEPDLNGVPAIVVNYQLEAPVPDNSSEPPATEDIDVYVEVFSDDKRIGRTRRNKVELTCTEKGSDIFAELDFFSRTEDGNWLKRQTFSWVNDNLIACSPEVMDFNNDGFGDLTFVSSTAARGANEIRTLLVYDKNIDKLIHIKNSESYPNLDYNKKLDCLTSMMFHGSSTTVFLRIEGDELKAFARVTTGAELSVSVLKGDQWVETYKRKMHPDDIYTRYSTYDPPRPYYRSP